MKAFKRTAFIFILIANMVILVHAVLPHHHHEDQVCFYQPGCCDNSLSATHFCHGHHDECNGKEENCILKQLVILPSTQERFKTENSTTHDIRSLIYISEESSLLKINDDFTEDICLSDEVFTDFHIKSNSGLRAPPRV